MLSLPAQQVGDAQKRSIRKELDKRAARRANPSLPAVTLLDHHGRDAGAEYTGKGAPSAAAMDRAFSAAMRHVAGEVGKVSAADRKQLRGVFFRAFRSGVGRGNPALDAYGDVAKPIKKGYVKLSGRVVKVGSKLHRELVQQSKHFEDLARGESGRGNPAERMTRGEALKRAAAVARTVPGAKVRRHAWNITVLSKSGKHIVSYLGNKNGFVKAQSNPAEAAAEVFEEFHGFAPSEVVTVTKEIHYHKHLAAAGKLTSLGVWGVDDIGHTITGFRGAILAFNEGKNQLFVEGGDQRINLEDFGLDSPHELETLGRVTDIGYFGKKTHLGDEGGEAVYVHKFRTTNKAGKHVVVKIARYPDLIYDVRNEQLLFSGGSYEILREGINK
jgi:hypothetical protein